MYGMGNGADKILCVCASLGIEVADFFASDVFGRGHSFHGKAVLSFSQVKEKYKKFIVLLSFATSIDNVLENIQIINDDESCELYAPDVAVYGDNLFDMAFYQAHENKIKETLSFLADQESRAIYKDIIAFKLTGKISYLTKWKYSDEEVFNSILNTNDLISYADLGAYNGDTIRELIPFAKNLEKIIAFEPDRRNYKKLCEYAQSIEKPIIKAYQIGAWSKESTLTFDSSGNRNASIINNSLKSHSDIRVNSLDNILCGDKVDYIKYDVEGSEKEALIGSKSTIKTHRPSICLSIYHRSEDIFALPLMLHEMFPFYSCYIRKKKYIPAWDVNLYCVPKL